jgi:uncharacterized zinc-type alcohol dehydrogenase-like protein
MEALEVFVCLKSHCDPFSMSSVYLCRHEIVGIVIDVGDQVTKFKVGDRAGVGVLVDSCRDCQYCKMGEEMP